MTNSDSESDDDGSMLHVGLEEFAEMIAEEMLKRYGNANDDDDSDDDDDSMPPLEDLPSTAAAKNSATSGEDSDDDDDDDDSMPPLEEISASALASASASASASSSNGTNERKRTSAGSSGGTSSARSGSPAIATSASPSAASSTSTTPFTFTAAPVTESRGALSRRTRPSTTTAREKQKKSQEGAKKQSATSTGSTTPFTFSTTSAPAAESSSSSSTPTPFQFTVPANTNTGSKTSAAPSLDPRLNAAAAAAAASASNNNPFSFTPSPSSTNGTGGRRIRTNKTNKTKGRGTAAGSDSTSAASPPLSPLFGASSKTSSNIGKAKSGGDNVPFRFGPTKAAAATASPTSSATATAASSVSGPPSSGTNADQAERAAAAAVSSSNNGKKKKGPKPKRNQSAFFLYSNQVRASVKEQNPNASFGEVAKIISTQFKALSATDRAKYDKLAAEDKARYQREMAQWEKEDDRKPPTTSSSTSTARVRATFAVGATANVRPHNTQDLAEAAAAARADAARVMEECKVEVGSGGSRRCDCPSCRMSSLATQPGAGDMSQDAPAGDAFSFPLTPPGILFNGGGVPGSDGNARRIVRARRPPNAPDTSTSTTPTSANIVGGLSGEGITPGNSGNRPRRRIIGARRPPRATGTDTTPSNANANSARNVVSLSSASAATSNQGPSRSTANHNATLGSGARNRARGNARRAPRAVIPVDDTDEEAKDDDDNNNQNSVDQSENANPNTNAFDALADDSNADDNSDGDSSLSDSDDDDPYSPSEDDSDDDSEDFMNNHFNQIMQAAIGNFARRVNRPSPQRPASNIRPDDDDDSAASSDDEDGSVAGGAKCAVCFRRDDPSHKWRRLVTLPCCGTDGKDGERTEKTSSTRFCAACILKLAVTRPDSSSNNGEYHRWEDERDEPPTSRFYNENRQSDTKRFIECPRCRDILIVKLKGLTTKANTELDKESSSGECDCTECRAERRANHPPAKIKTAKSISLHRASFKGKAWYVGRKREMANIMWKAAHLHHSFMPLAALGGDKYKSNVMRLVGWGVLRKVPGKKSTDVFWMDRKDQAELVKLVSPQAKNETEEEAGKECDLFFELAFHMATAAKESLMKYRVDQVVRLVNRFLYLFLYFKRYLPPPPLPLWQELVVTAFNVFNLVLILQFLLILAAYAGLFFGVGFSVCYGLRRGNIRSIWWQAILVGYFAFRFSKAIYNCSYFSWMGFVSPKAWIPIKKIVWG